MASEAERENALLLESSVKYPNATATLFQCVQSELRRAYAKHGRDQWTRHEFYAILLEEVEELWDVIKHDDSGVRLAAELIQVVAMCCRYVETGNRLGDGL